MKINFSRLFFCALSLGLVVSCKSDSNVFMPFKDIASAPSQTVYDSYSLVTEEGKRQPEPARTTELSPVRRTGPPPLPNALTSIPNEALRAL